MPLTTTICDFCGTEYVLQEYGPVHEYSDKCYLAKIAVLEAKITKLQSKVPKEYVAEMAAFEAAIR